MSRSLDRRNFLKLSAAGAAGSILAGSGSLHAGTSTFSKTTATNGIIHRTLGRTGMSLPVVNLGVMRVDNPRIVTMALDGGMTLLDTAHGYQNGRNEEMLGQLLENRPRDSFYLATKVSARGTDMSTEEFISTFEISLERLKLDYVDILYLHGPSSREAVLQEEHLGALMKLREQGRTRFIGVTTHSNEPEVIRAAVESGEYDVVCPAYNFNMGNLPDLKDAIAEAAGAGLGVIVMKTMAGAYWDRERQDPINTRAALKWALQNENIHTSIPGVTAFQELEDNFEVMKDISMTPGEIGDLRLDTADTGMYCLGCEKCTAQCRQKLPVPDMMRSYMYAYGYRDLSLSRATMDSLDLIGPACESCTSCAVKCTQGFDVAGKIKDIDRIRQVPSEFIT
ncbi:MAG: twin-arginine translocation signal domain-containing protein [Marinilabiliales bacterium]|nr:MAG: twin-arginine translocation signal domain-containing protein [Marinilabiliales bacterium]